MKMNNPENYFSCKENDEIIQTYCHYTKKAWVPAINVCNQRLYVRHNVPDVPELRLETNEDEDNLYIYWTPNNRYYTKIQIKQDDGEWTTIGIFPPGVGEAGTEDES